jgi:hypothetical protein
VVKDLGEVAKADIDNLKDNFSAATEGNPNEVAWRVFQKVFGDQLTNILNNGAIAAA